MKKKYNSKPIDMTHCGPIIDKAEGGYQDYSRNLRNLLTELFMRRIRPKNRRRIQIFVSIVCESDDDPRRENLIVNYTFGYICRLYKRLENTDFDVDVVRKQTDSRLEAYQS